MHPLVTHAQKVYKKFANDPKLSEFTVHPDVYGVQLRFKDRYVVLTGLPSSIKVETNVPMTATEINAVTHFTNLLRLSSRAALRPEDYPEQARA